MHTPNTHNDVPRDSLSAAYNRTADTPRLDTVVCLRLSEWATQLVLNKWNMEAPNRLFQRTERYN